MPITTPAAKGRFRGHSQTDALAETTEEGRDRQRGEKAVDHCRDAGENFQDGLGDGANLLGGIVGKVDRSHQADWCGDDHGDQRDQQRADEKRNNAENILVDGAGLGARAGEGALRRPVRAEQEFVNRDLLEEAQRFEDQGQDDADRGQDRHDGACDEEGLEYALHDMAGAIFRLDARPGEPAAGGGKRKRDDPDYSGAPGMDRFERLGSRHLGRVGEADDATERDGARVADKSLHLRKPHRGKLGSETAGNDPGLDPRSDDRPDSNREQGWPGREQGQEHSVRAGKRVQARNLAVHLGERARTAGEKAAGKKN